MPVGAGDPRKPDSHEARMRTLHQISEEKREAAEMAEARSNLDFIIWETEQELWWDRGAK